MLGDSPFGEPPALGILLLGNLLSEDSPFGEPLVLFFLLVNLLLGGSSIGEPLARKFFYWGASRLLWGMQPMGMWIPGEVRCD